MFIYDARRSTYSLAALISYLAPQPNLQGRQGGLEHAQDQGAESGRLVYASSSAPLPSSWMTSVGCKDEGNDGVESYVVVVF